MSSNQYLADVYSRRQYYLDRYNRHQALQLKEYISEAITAAYKLYRDENLTEWSKERLAARMTGLKSVLSDIYRDFPDDFVKNTGELIQEEFDFTSQALSKAVAGNFTAAVPNLDIAKQIITAKPLKLTSKLHDIPDAISKYTEHQQRKIITTVQAAAEESVTLEEMKTRLASVGVDATDEAERLARTINNHVVTEARTEILRENDDVLDGWRAVATLDSRTTPICASLDNRVFGWNDPKPPFHWGCRTSMSPSVSQQYNRNITGTRAAKGASGKTEQVNANLSYETWLRRQPAEFQKDTLGPGKYELFSKHQLPMEKFVDYNHKPLSLREIRERNGITLAEPA